MRELEILAAIALLVVLALFFPLVPPEPLTAEQIHEQHPTWSVADCRKIAEQAIWIGMTDDMAKASRGICLDINRSVGSWGVHEQWVYRQKYRPTWYLYFEDGFLVSWQKT